MNAIDALRLANALFQAKAFLSRLYPDSMMLSYVKGNEPVMFQYYDGSRQFLIKFAKEGIVVTQKGSIKVCANPDELARVFTEIL